MSELDTPTMAGAGDIEVCPPPGMALIREIHDRVHRAQRGPRGRARPFRAGLKRRPWGVK
ncbi:hypothetical protein KRM28CT15_13540 [Krasilnikovia sp. M28-CT-15]